MTSWLQIGGQEHKSNDTTQCMVQFHAGQQLKLSSKKLWSSRYYQTQARRMLKKANGKGSMKKLRCKIWEARKVTLPTPCSWRVALFEPNGGE